MALQVDRECPLGWRHTWAVFKVGALWRVLRPSRSWACHEIDAWAGDFGTHTEALAFATDPAVRVAVLDRAEISNKPAGLDRDIWIEGLTAECVGGRVAGGGGRLSEP